MNQKQSWEEELKELLDNGRTGLKESSDTNKTRYAILAIFEQAIQTREREISEEVESKNLFPYPKSESQKEHEYNMAILDEAHEQAKETVLSIINKRKCACKEISEKYFGGIKFVEAKTASGGITGVMHIKCPVHDL